MHPAPVGGGTVSGLLRRPPEKILGFAQRVDPLPDAAERIEAASFVEHHRAGRDDRFGHRIDPPDRVISDVKIAFAVRWPLARPDELPLVDTVANHPPKRRSSTSVEIGAIRAGASGENPFSG